MHPLDAAHLDDIGARAAHIRAAHIQEVCQIDDMRLLGTVFKDGLALRHDGGKHPVHGRADADLIEEDMSAGQALLGADRDHAVVHAVLRAEGAEGLEVLVDGAGAKVTAAGHGHLCLAVAGQQRAEEVVAGAHLAGQIVRHIGAGEVGGVDLVGVPVQHPDLGAKDAQDLQAHRHIADIGQILNDADVTGQNGGRQNAHSRIFCARDGDRAVQGLTARNNKLFQFYDLLVVGLRVTAPKGFRFSSLVISDAYQKGKSPHDMLSYYTQLRPKSKDPFAQQGLFSVLPRKNEDIL